MHQLVSTHTGSRRQNVPIGFSKLGDKVFFCHKLNFPAPLPIILIIRLTLLLLTLLSFESYGQELALQANNSDQDGSSQMQSPLPLIIAGKWKSSGKIHTLRGDQCKNLPYCDIGLEYGLRSVSSRSYTDGKDRYLVEIFEMRFPSGAYGFMTFNRSKLSSNQQQFQAGRYLINVRNQNNTNFGISQFSKELLRLFGNNKVALPSLAEHLPQTNKIDSSEIYITGPKALIGNKNFGFLSSTLSFESGSEAVSAEYRLSQGIMGLLLVEFHTPQLTTDGYDKVDSFLASFNEIQRSQIVLRRIGNYIVIATNIPNKQAAESIIGEIKYTAKVYWEGNKFSSIPLEFRPLDPTAFEEASETAKVLIRTFYWIGLMLLITTTFGVFAGTGFFYWRKYQRKKYNETSLFTDGVETIRLNLDTDTVNKKILEGSLRTGQK